MTNLQKRTRKSDPVDLAADAGNNTPANMINKAFEAGEPCEVTVKTKRSLFFWKTSPKEGGDVATIEFKGKFNT